MGPFPSVGTHVAPQLARMFEPAATHRASVPPLPLSGEEGGVAFGVGSQLFGERKLFVTLGASDERRYF